MQIIRDVLEAWLGATILPVVLEPLAQRIAESLAEGAPLLEQPQP